MNHLICRFVFSRRNKMYLCASDQCELFELEDDLS